MSSLKMADDQAQFELLLVNLMSSDNDTRVKSEEVYNAIDNIKKLELLLRSLRNGSTSLENRSMSCILLRRLFCNEFTEVWPTLEPDIQNSIKAQLMMAIREELSPPVRKKICEVVAELARNLIGEENDMMWPEVLKFMFECASSPEPGLRESALTIFSSVPTIFGNQQAHYLDVIKQMLLQCLQDRAHPMVCFMAVKCLSAFVIANDKDQTILNHYKDLVPAMMDAMVDSVSAQDDDDLLKCLIELAESTPKFLRPQMENIIPFCLKVLSDANLGDQWRQLAMEAIVTLSETAPAMVRKFGKFIPLLVPQILALMVDLEEEDDWAVQDDQDDEDNDSNSVAAESALDRLACALGGKTMLPHILANIPQMLASDDWRYRHAALMAISACGEGCHTHMEQMLQNITDGILPFFKDPHPRVRFATCNAVGQMCTDFGPTFQKKFHEKLVAELLHIMDDDANPRVQAHGAAALVNFSEDCPKNILVQYLDPIVQKLEQVLSRKFKELLEKVLILIY
ncbi:importin-5 [Patella vulgata]|uniref:importin-5 n=1 Tax=Patella vulgata TaxID=6465 RepID=UPI00218057C0|nr:importin-5 [Patella vulgata]